MNKYILGSILFVLACLTGCDDSNDPLRELITLSLPLP